MKVTLSNNTEILIFWKHLRDKNTTTDIGTRCTIETVINATILCSARSHVVKGDQFCKAKGRKISLTRALKEGNFSKEDRTLIWYEYNVSINKATKPKQ